MAEFQRVPFGEFARPVARPVKVQPGVLYRTLGVKWWGEGAYERATMDGTTIRTETLSIVKTGDLIFNKIWVRHGSSGVIPPEMDGCVASGEFPTFELDTGKIDHRWLLYLFKTAWFWEQCNLRSQGTSGKNRIKPGEYLQIAIPLPPLAEQQRIVARVEALARRIEEARGLRREAVVAAEALWGAGAVEVLHKPEQAERKTMGEICEIRGGIQKSPGRYPRDNPTPYLTVAHVQRNRLDVLSDFRFFEVTPDELPRWRLESGDLLIIEGNGSADQIGRVALFRGEIKNCVHQNHVIRARPDQNIARPEYLNAYLNSPLGQDEVQKRSRTTSGLRTLSVGRIREIEIPVPSLPEQRRIVAYLDGLQAKVDDLRRLQAETQKELDVMMPSILAKAFAGEL